MIETLGIHSSVAGSAGISDGHAWLSMHFTNGRSTTIGLWTSSLMDVKRFVRDPTGVILDESFDVNFGREAEKGYQAAASRFYRISDTQAHRAVALMGSYTGWRFTNTCASWATNVVKELIGEDLDAGELGGATDTPRALGTAIQRLEKADPTSLQNPRRIHSNPIVKGSMSK